MTCKFKIGDRVKFVNNCLLASKDFPRVGSEFECAGTVTNVEPLAYRRGYYEFTVRWDNGHTIYANDTSLDFAEDVMISKINSRGLESLRDVLPDVYGRKAWAEKWKAGKEV